MHKAQPILLCLQRTLKFHPLNQVPLQEDVDILDTLKLRPLQESIFFFFHSEVVYNQFSKSG